MGNSHYESCPWVLYRLWSDPVEKTQVLLDFEGGVERTFEGEKLFDDIQALLVVARNITSQGHQIVSPFEGIKINPSIVVHQQRITQRVELTLLPCSLPHIELIESQNFSKRTLCIREWQRTTFFRKGRPLWCAN